MCWYGSYLYAVLQMYPTIFFYNCMLPIWSFSDCFVVHFILILIETFPLKKTFHCIMKKSITLQDWFLSFVNKITKWDYLAVKNQVFYIASVMNFINIVWCLIFYSLWYSFIQISIQLHHAHNLTEEKRKQTE